MSRKIVMFNGGKGVAINLRHQSQIIENVYTEHNKIDKRIIFRVQGDFWHANPILYELENLTKIQKFNIGRDRLAKDYFESKGWKVFDIWESDIYWRVEEICKQIGPLVQLASTTVLHTVGSEFKSRGDHWDEALRKRWFAKTKKRRKAPRKCFLCEKEFIYTTSKQKFCSPECAHQSLRRTTRPSVAVLEQEMKIMSWCALGRKYNVTDNSVRKWAKQYRLLQ